MIYKRDYTVGLKNRTDIPRHALWLPWTKYQNKNRTGKCFAFFEVGTGKEGSDKPISVTLVPINEMFPVSKRNFKIKLLN